MDISGSMEGEKIDAARVSLIQFIDRLDVRDRLKLILFREVLLDIVIRGSLCNQGHV
jgi:uncharacterized protein with von Willebrand factor type A (vWA) domain